MNMFSSRVQSAFQKEERLNGILMYSIFRALIISKYIQITNRMRINILWRNLYYSQYSYQHVSAGIPAIFSVLFYKNTIVVNHVIITTQKLKLYNVVKII
jgi:hypothetical protein